MEIYVTCPAWIKRRSGLFRNHIENTRLCSILQSSSMLGIILFGGFSSIYSEYVQHLSWQIIFSFCKTTNISLIHKRKSIDIATVMNQNENLKVKIEKLVQIVFVVFSVVLLQLFCRAFVWGEVMCTVNHDTDTMIFLLHDMW